VSLNHSEFSTAASVARKLLPRAVARPIKQKLLTWAERRSMAEQKLNAATYAKAKYLLQDDIRLVQQLMPVDLSHWSANDRRFSATG
ncbi:MAG: hypothetical protein ABW049_01965, partial [Spongiibacteraceae bacterium]